MSPFFSVIIPTYNRSSFLKKCVDSVLGQTFCDMEIIIVDDGSTDNTVTMLSGYREQSMTYLFNSHHGVSHARNSGIGTARGKYVSFLDSDDSWDEKKLEITKEYIDRSPGINIFHTDEIWYRAGKILNQKAKHRRPEGFIYYDCLPLCCIGMSTAVVKKSLFDEVGLFDESFPACEDYDFWLRACLENEVKLIPLPLTIKDGGREDQLSSSTGLDKLRITALEKMLNSGKLDERQREETYKELVNKCRIYANGAAKRGREGEAEDILKKIDQYK